MGIFAVGSISSLSNCSISSSNRKSNIQYCTWLGVWEKRKRKNSKSIGLLGCKYFGHSIDRKPCVGSFKISPLIYPSTSIIASSQYDMWFGALSHSKNIINFSFFKKPIFCLVFLTSSLNLVKVEVSCMSVSHHMLLRF